MTKEETKRLNKAIKAAKAQRDRAIIALKKYSILCEHVMDITQDIQDGARERNDVPTAIIATRIYCDYLKESITARNYNI